MNVEAVSALESSPTPSVTAPKIGYTNGNCRKTPSRGQYGELQVMDPATVIKVRVMASPSPAAERRDIPHSCPGLLPASVA